MFIHEKLNTPQLFPFKHVHALLIPLIIRILQIFFLFFFLLFQFLLHIDKIPLEKFSLAVPLHFLLSYFFFIQSELFIKEQSNKRQFKKTYVMSFFFQKFFCHKSALTHHVYSIYICCVKYSLFVLYIYMPIFNIKQVYQLSTYS